MDLSMKSYRRQEDQDNNNFKSPDVKEEYYGGLDMSMSRKDEQVLSPPKNEHIVMALDTVKKGENEIDSKKDLQVAMPPFPHTSRSLESLERLTEHWENNNNKCPHSACHKQIEDNDNLLNHWYTTHMAPGYCQVFICRVCSESVQKQSEFVKHVQLKHDVPESQAILIAEFMNGLWECKVSEDSLADTIYIPPREAINEQYQEMFGLNDECDDMFVNNDFEGHDIHESHEDELKDDCGNLLMNNRKSDDIKEHYSDGNPEECDTLFIDDQKSFESDDVKESQDKDQELPYYEHAHKAWEMKQTKQSRSTRFGWHQPMENIPVNYKIETKNELHVEANQEFIQPIHQEILDLEHVPPERQEVPGLPWKGMDKEKSNALEISWQDSQKYCPHPFCNKDKKGKRKLTVKKMLFSHWHQHHLLPGCGIPYICFGRDSFTHKSCDKTYDNKWDLIEHCRKTHCYRDPVIQILLHKIKVMRETGKAQQYLPVDMLNPLYNKKQNDTPLQLLAEDNTTITRKFFMSKPNRRMLTVAEALKAKREHESIVKGNQTVSLSNDITIPNDDNLQGTSAKPYEFLSFKADKPMQENSLRTCAILQGFSQTYNVQEKTKPEISASYLNGTQPKPATPEVATNMLLPNSQNGNTDLPMALWKVILKAWHRDMSCPHPSCQSKSWNKYYSHILLLRHWSHKHINHPHGRLYPCFQKVGPSDTCAYVFSSERDFSAHLFDKHGCMTKEIGNIVHDIVTEWDLYEKGNCTSIGDNEPSHKKRRTSSGESVSASSDGGSTSPQPTITADDKLRIEKAMANFVHSLILPGKKDCLMCLEMLGLKGIDWKIVKNQIFNKVQKIKRAEKKKLTRETDQVYRHLYTTSQN